MRIKEIGVWRIMMWKCEMIQFGLVQAHAGLPTFFLFFFFIFLGQTYLTFCCSSLAGQNFSIFEKKKKFDHIIELIYTHTRFVTDDLFVAQHVNRFRLHCAIRVQNHCSQEKASSNLLSRLGEDKFSESDFFFTGHLGLFCD